MEKLEKPHILISVFLNNILNNDLSFSHYAQPHSTFLPPDQVSI